jgi:hypothetical protein
MDPMPCVSVDATHPVVTAVRWRSGKAAMERETPPTQTSPPHLAKAISATARSAGLARSGASLAARTDAASARSCSNMGSASVSGSNLNPLVGVADIAVPPLSEVSEDEDEDDDDNDSLEMIIGNLFPHGPGVEGDDCGGDEYGEEEGGGEDDDIDFPNTDDADSVPDAEVKKYSFLERLRHYMDGKKISDANRKCVEWTILFKVGTLVRNMGTMRTADMEASIFRKYVNIVCDIEDEHFKNDSVRAKMLHRFKADKQDLCGRNLLFRWKSETANFRSFWYKFLGDRRMSDLPSGSNQIKHMKKQYIASLWAKENPVRLYVVLLSVVIYITHNTMILTLSLLESQRNGGLLLSHARICLHVSCTRVTLT